MGQFNLVLHRMDYKKQVEDALGKPNLKLFYAEIKNGNITLPKLKHIGKLMHDNVNGVYERKKGEDELVLAAYMMDCWYTQVLYTGDVDAVSRLKEIFEDPILTGFEYLTEQFEAKKEKFTIGLPKAHSQIPRELQTGQPAGVSFQLGSDCASHAVTKAVVEQLNSLGYDCDPEKINDALNPHKEKENPDYFDGKQVKVFVTKTKTNKYDGNVKGNIDIQIGVQTTWATVGDDLDFELTPLIPLPSDMNMVVRWDIGMTLADKNIHGNHAIFAKKYNEDKKTYSCINSWGTGPLERPNICQGRIYAVDYMTIIEL